MNPERTKEGEKPKRKLLLSIFPQEYDFEGMLADQSEGTAKGVRMLLEWLRAESMTDPTQLDVYEAHIDSMRHSIEDKLGEAFSTPFDRHDIYNLSRQTGYVLNYSVVTAREMHAFGVTADQPILQMTEALLSGTVTLSRAMRNLHTDGRQMHDIIHEVREAIRSIEHTYIAGMAEQFRSQDVMEALRRREIYHHLRDAGRSLSITADILHSVTVGLD
jgi:uncharacterized protein Yka (UPF0111/DUF47 family)